MKDPDTRRQRNMRRPTRPKALLTSLLLLMLAGTPTAKKRRSSGKGSQQHTSSSRKRECEITVCADTSEDDRSNCVLQCQSAECYAKVYADNELEPGEIDMKRTREYNICTQEELRKQSKENARARREGTPQVPPEAEEASTNADRPSVEL